MPIYDFKCNKCGHVEEFLVGVIQNPVPENCPICKEGKLEKQFSAKGQSFDVVGGYSYQYGKKSYTKKSPEERAKYLVKDENGKYKNPY